MMCDNGTKAVGYYGMAGLFIEAIKAISAQIDTIQDSLDILKIRISSLETRLDHLESLIGGEGSTIPYTGINSNEDNNNNVLFQNVPNPFSQSTYIRYSASNSASRISILIFNAQGSLIKTYNVNQGLKIK